MKAAFYTLGCKVNQYETQQLRELLGKNSIETVDLSQKADIYIVNSCTVTKQSTRKSRQAVRRLKNMNRDAVVVMTGCVPQAFPEEALSVEQADIILGNNSNMMIMQALKEFFAERKRVVMTKPHEKNEKYSGCAVSSFSGHTRAFVKIQDGCNRFCSYCAIPYARGRARSKPYEDIEAELECLADSGFTEVVFVGINLSSYGRDLGLSIVDAVKLAEKNEKLKRVRLGSLEPDHITQEILLGLAECKKFCPQFHISLQSGCDRTLSRMNRHYTASEYADLCSNIRRIFERASITTDVIAGFPGETQEDFDATCDFLRQMRFEKVHVFPYSVREGTRAASFPDKLSEDVKNARAAQLSLIADSIRLEIFKECVGLEANVLFERSTDGFASGYTENYTPVRVKSEESLGGKILKVKIIDSGDDCCFGELIE